MKTSELTGKTLDWAVTTIEEPDALRYGVADWIEQRRSKAIGDEFVHRYHQNWNQAGPIIEREKINITTYGNDWKAIIYHKCGLRIQSKRYGSTPLVAAMRCYVQSKMGDEVEIPEELQ